jgi:hypothetical protein
MRRRPLSAQRQPVELRHLRTAEQAQQSLEFAAVVGGGVKLEGKSASIKSSSECIQSSNAISLSSCFERFSSSFSRISLAGSRRQLSIRKNERKGDSDEPDAPLLGERELAVGEGDVVIGGEKRDQANNTANNGFQQGFAIEPQPPPGQRRIQIPRSFIHPKQPDPIPITASLVHAYASLVPGATPPEVSALLVGRRSILVTDGAGVVRRLLEESYALVFNLDKMGYASDLSSIEGLPQAAERHSLLRVGLTDAAATAEAVRQADPGLVMHLAAESHVDRSIKGPAAYGSTSSPDCVYDDSNVTGTFHLLQAVRSHWEALPAERADGFRFHHISTDEVFGSLGATGRFSETNA